MHLRIDEVGCVHSMVEKTASKRLHVAWALRAREKSRDSAACFYSRLQRGLPSVPGRPGDELCILDTDPVCQSSTALTAVRPKGLGFPSSTHLRQALSARVG